MSSTAIFSKIWLIGFPPIAKPHFAFSNWSSRFAANPFDGIGKPEPLRHLGPGIWSRRITQEHRLVYRVKDDRILFAQARYHY